MNKQKRKQSDNNDNNHIQSIGESEKKKMKKNLTSPKQTKKDTLVTSNSTPPTPMFSNLATNVSNMGNAFNHAVQEISHSVKQGVAAVIQMNKALETMVESSIDIHTEVLRNEDIIGEVFLNLKIWNKSPFPIMGHGDLEFRFDVVNANKSENYVDSAFYSIALRDDRISSERSNKGCTRFSIDNVSLMPRQFKIFKFMFCRCQPQSTITNRSLQSSSHPNNASSGSFQLLRNCGVKNRYDGNIYFHFDSPGSDTVLTSENKFQIYAIQQMKPIHCIYSQLNDEKHEIINNILKVAIKNRWKLHVVDSIDVQKLRCILGIHATEPLIIDDGVYCLDENLYVMLSGITEDNLTKKNSINSYHDILKVLHTKKMNNTNKQEELLKRKNNNNNNYNNNNKKTKSRLIYTNHVKCYFISNDIEQMKYMQMEFQIVSMEE